MYTQQTHFLYVSGIGRGCALLLLGEALTYKTLSHTPFVCLSARTSPLFIHNTVHTMH